MACDVVWAETAAAFPSEGDARDALGKLGIAFGPLDVDAASTAAMSWRSYRADGGGRGRVVADFLIAAHASAHADRLLTRDRGFYRTRFQALAVVDPSEA